MAITSTAITSVQIVSDGVIGRTKSTMAEAITATMHAQEHPLRVEPLPHAAGRDPVLLGDGAQACGPGRVEATQLPRHLEGSGEPADDGDDDREHEHCHGRLLHHRRRRC